MYDHVTFDSNSLWYAQVGQTLRSISGIKIPVFLYQETFTGIIAFKMTETSAENIVTIGSSQNVSSLLSLSQLSIFVNS